MEINQTLIKDYPAALDRAVRMLAERPRSKKEIEDKLISAKYDQEVISLVLYKLEKENLLNDRVFAEQWVESRSRKYGSARIIRELRVKGIDKDTVSSALEGLSDEDQIEKAVFFAEKRIRSYHGEFDPYKQKQRVITALIRRGYSWEIASKAYEKAVNRVSVR